MSNPSEHVDAAVLRGWELPDPGESKKDRGDAVIVGASRRTPGAVVLAFEAAMRVGAGRVALLVPGSIDAQLGVRIPEAAVLVLPEDPEDAIEGAGGEALAAAGAVLVGPGFDDAAQTRSTLHAVLDAQPRRVVLDAYALGILPDVPAERLPDDVVLTPNKEEVDILLGREADDFDAALREVARRYGAVVASYGRVAAPDGRMWEIDGGGPGLATAGSGDVLSGAITGFLARGVATAEAAVWGTWVHARAGDVLGASHGLGFLARELAAALPAAVLEATGEADADADEPRAEDDTATDATGEDSAAGATGGDATADLPVAAWLDRLSAPSGDTGGGAGCALLVAASAAQLAMVAGYLDDGESQVRTARRVRDDALRDADRDGDRSRALGDALRDGSDEAVRATAEAAADSALKVGEHAASLLDDWAEVKDAAADYLQPDVVVGVAALAAAVEGAAAIATANLTIAERRDAETGDARTRLSALQDALTRAREMLR